MEVEHAVELIMVQKQADQIEIVQSFENEAEGLAVDHVEMLEFGRFRGD